MLNRQSRRLRNVWKLNKRLTNLLQNPDTEMCWDFLFYVNLKMRFFLITTISILLIGCNNEVKETCLQESLVQKLNDFKVELADSLSIPTKQITLVEILVKKSQERKHIPINLIEFSSKEIES